MSSWFRTYGYAEVADRLLVGAYPLDADDVGMLAWMGVRKVLNLTEDEEYGPGQRSEVEEALQRAGIDERRIELRDFGALPPPLITRAVRTVGEWLDGGQLVYVHCRAGWQRSPTIAAAVLMAREGLDPDPALERIRRAKPSAEPLEHQREDLERWWRGRSCKSAAEDG
jgi:atypical dual specificity phosphatase